ncbi:MAG: endonuclease MutS2 [Nitrospirae bacterium]|nr:endonuclease MutS2 [Nitrospirota bacterium]
MDEHTLRVLEFYKVRDILRGYAASEPGMAEVDRLVPSTDPKWVARSLKEAQELRSYLDSRREFPITGLKDISSALKKAAVEGATLRPEELLAVLSVARTSRMIKAALGRAGSTWPLLSARAASLHVFEAVEAEVGRSIGEDGEVLDAASPELRRIRRGITMVRARINKELEAIIQNPAFAKAVQEPVITMRADRYVLPLKPNYKMYLQGIVHDHSASGSTVFVEPEKTVELNNKLTQYRVDEGREVERVLWALTTLVRESGDGLAESLQGLSALDLIYAKASYALSIGAGMPAMSDRRGVIDLKSARHPLLVKVKGVAAVPLDASLGRDYNCLVVTGPNTGGKTVVLKTVGLLVLMAQAGMLIPASPDSVLSVFEEVFSDIGDEQSLEQSLSTFSSHITQIVRILGAAGRESLVLLDELGAGTDPAEGSSLGVAILEELNRRGTRVIVTSHHRAMKVYAENTPGVINASVEFDAETLSPTYRLLIGRPGRSSALLIAKRLGMPERIIQAAAKMKDTGEAQLDSLIERLERETVSAREDRRRASEELVRANEDRERLAGLLKRADEERRAEVGKAREKARSIVASLKQKSRELDELGRKAAPPARDEVRQKVEEIKALEAELASEASTPPPVARIDINALHEGDMVKVYKYNKLGKVLSVNREKETAVVQLDSMKVTLGIMELEPAKGAKPGTPKKAGVALTRAAGDEAGPGIELNIIGQHVEEALGRVEQYVDDCMLASIGSVRIIHGRGTGALRKAVHELLKSHPGVKGFHKAAFEDGGDAVTVVEFR